MIIYKLNYKVIRFYQKNIEKLTIEFVLSTFICVNRTKIEFYLNLISYFYFNTIFDYNIYK